MYSVEAVKAVLKRLRKEKGPRDPGWMEVEAGRRVTFRIGEELFPSLTREMLNKSGLTWEYAQMPLPTPGFSTVRTFLTEDIEALVKKHALDVKTDPLWASVEKGDYMTQDMVLTRYKEITAWKFRVTKLPSRPVCAETPR